MSSKTLDGNQGIKPLRAFKEPYLILNQNLVDYNKNKERLQNRYNELSNS